MTRGGKKIPGNNAADKDLFRELMADVRPLARKEKVAPAKKTGLSPKHAEAQESFAALVDQSSFEHGAAMPDLKPGRGDNIDRATFERFRKGGMDIEATLDLHGLTQQQAFAETKRFILRCHNNGSRCVLVITGKGGKKKTDNIFESTGVLRENFQHWINSGELRPKILAFAPAIPKHGGGGAFYILLKRQRG